MAQLVAFQFTGLPDTLPLGSSIASAPPTASAAGLTASDLTPANLTLFAIFSGTGYTTVPMLAARSLAATAAAAISASRYFSFTLTADPGSVLNLSQLAFKGARGGSSTPRGCVVRSSVDGYASTIGGGDFPTARPTWTQYTIPLGAAFQNLQAVTFRFYPYVPDSSATTAEFDDIIVDGTLGSTAQLVGSEWTLRWSSRALAARTLSTRWLISAEHPTPLHGYGSTSYAERPYAAQELLQAVAVNDNLTVRWRVAETHVSTIRFYWRDLEPVEDQRGLRWRVAQLATSDRTLSWSMVAQARADLALRWSGYALAAATKAVRWRLAQTTASDRTVRWNALAAALAAFSARWNVLGLAAAILRPLWEVVEVGAVGSNLGLAWDRRQLVTADRILSWAGREQVAGQVGIVWGGREIVGAEATVLWDAGVGATSALRISWTSHVHVGRPLAVRWRSSELVARQAQLRWAGRQLAGRSRTLLWSAAGRSGSDLSVLWNMVQPAISERVFDWSLDQNVSSDLDLRWSGPQQAASEVTFHWSGTGRASADVRLLWYMAEIPPDLVGMVMVEDVMIVRVA